MADVFIYVVARDFGFAPNPFHGYCTLATCKPRIRGAAAIGDWVLGVGGARLKATGRLTYAMKVTAKVSFDEYWSNPRFSDKKPVRNGSKKMMLGDNIYHRDPLSSDWQQADSHHSNVDGTVNCHNLQRDTSTDYVLISEDFYYFGSAAPAIPRDLLTVLGYANGIGHRRYSAAECHGLLDWLKNGFENERNQVVGNPFDFDESHKRFATNTNKLT